MKFEKEMKIIRKGTDEIITEEELLKKLEISEESGRPLRIKYGIDPTGFDVHIGHLVPIRKMREFQDMGHTGVIIIGDFTARIGDPSGKDETRPHLTAEQVENNAQKYMEQLYKVLDKDKTEVRWQTEWFGNMTMADVLKLMGKFTLAQFMAHETFRSRYEKGIPLGIHEIMYPILQGYDSVAIKADVELGATEQKFNILAGRDMQKYFGQLQQVAILSPILMGTDGKEKMSKSLNNYIAVFDPPKEKYGKTMSIPDDMILNYFNYATKLDTSEIEKIASQLKNNEVNPKVIKQRLAREIVTIYHGEKAAMEAEKEFNLIFSKKEIPDEIPTFDLHNNSMKLSEILFESGSCASGSEAKRLIKQNAISIDGKKIDDIFFEIDKKCVVKVGKRRFLKVVK
ncbi:MAG: tyrosine--tRNA ligase [Candidatus Cloacimonetes bacterium]|nr:tyrosine--tRNA ligase [Candidatus Cloacimonadota bacterium]